ncbi:unnamed protein product [Rotaria socialis]|uniref:Uncharacterized protein n=2 Tax=Rotaria socialis TaxID=392032 RepID=A0A820UUZ4_9BILA|nr:unnamed protein product [Rotaria socialis]CAF3490849.1 unnamed protein product [Rotaria socialis]CAF3676188.1 unnamed protein product [Rotaria socialis]CAF4121781.1 unnamed protein product [Rotaria socialis]CAF4255745.1 unnamed protein product [Rotaria socialis]
MQMTTQKVEATIDVKSENFHQTFEESILDSSTSKESCSYEELIAANERLKANLSKVFTEFVNKARLEQNVDVDQKKRKNQRDDGEEEDEEQQQDGDDDEDDAGSSDNDEQEE